MSERPAYWVCAYYASVLPGHVDMNQKTCPLVDRAKHQYERPMLDIECGWQVLVRRAGGNE